jgi:predicted metal-binding protein
MQYQLNAITATIEVDEYIRDYRDVDTFIGYCKQCACYNACWACPPFDFNATEHMMQYHHAHIIGTKIILDTALRNACAGVQQCKDTAYRIIRKVRRGLDRKLLALERQYPGSRAFFAGTCHMCKQGACTRIVGKPCVYPDTIRPSLEAFGFDIGKTSSQLLNTDLRWSSEEGLPEYFVLVSGLFTNREMKSITWQ